MHLAGIPLGGTATPKKACAPTAESGATMVEFALAAIALLMLIGAVFDVGLALHHRSFLQHVATGASRKIVACAAVNPSCALFNGCTRQALTEAAPVLAGAFAVGRDTTWTYSFNLSGNAPNFVLNGQMPLECFFLCRFLGSGSMLSASTSTSVEMAIPGGCPGTFHFPP